MKADWYQSYLDSGSHDIDAAFEKVCKNGGDIRIHCKLLQELAQQCNHATEFGVRYGVSTTAIMAGSPRKLVSYDVDTPPTLHHLERLAAERDVAFSFRRKNVLNLASIEKTDMLFIDTRHTYSQLHRELSIHACSVSKLIVMHDTETFGFADNGGDGPGMKKAIHEFLDNHRSWCMLLHRDYGHGLTVLVNQWKWG
jgi:predicted O-methyltransferase YrrM